MEGRRYLWFGAAAVILWFSAKYILPLVFPFVIGLILALLARPGTAFLKRRLHLPVAAASAVSVGLVILLFLVLVIALGAYALKQAAALAASVPDLQQTFTHTVGQARTLVTNALDSAPQSIQPILYKVVESTFQNGQGLVDSAVQRLPGALANLVSRISQGALTLGTGVLAGVMLSSRLPVLRQKLWAILPDKWKETYLPALSSAKKTLKGWLKAQLKLMAITWLIVSAGLMGAGVPYGFLWAILVAVVDAVPVLGTGTVLIPWALFLLLQGSNIQAVILFATAAAAMLTRAVLEPRLVGRQIGLDPLVTLAAFYVGFRLWGIPGMIFCPLLAAAGRTFWQSLSFKNNL